MNSVEVDWVTKIKKISKNNKMNLKTNFIYFFEKKWRNNINNIFMVTSQPYFRFNLLDYIADTYTHLFTLTSHKFMLTLTETFVYRQMQYSGRNLLNLFINDFFGFFNTSLNCWIVKPKSKLSHSPASVWNSIEIVSTILFSYIYQVHLKYRWCAFFIRKKNICDDQS